MDNGKSLINVGELAKPATALIEKISEALGGYFKPWQIRRVAQAEAEAEKIKALSKIETQIEMAELTQRALGRFLAEETKKQDNIESITSKAIPLLEDNSKPQKINDDWVTNFFDKCRLITDEEMQELWAKVLAGEANSPGKYSKRTVNFLGSLDKSDANQFTALCGFSWVIGNICPLVFNINDAIYQKMGINFNVLKHLDDIGLLSFEHLGGYIRTDLPKTIIVFYFSGSPIIIEFNNDVGNNIDIGKVMLSKIGQEIVPICGSKPVPGFLDYTIKHWIDKGLKLFSPYPRKIL
jgi:hypothetical protein